MTARPRPSISLEDAAIGVRFLWLLPGFLRNPIGLAEARRILRGRLERREADFLALARRAIYRHAASPYRELLIRAGCEYGDFARLVRQNGVEGALQRLYQSGVYLTVEEFKGRRPTVRGSATLAVNPERLRNPLSAPHVAARSGGSRGRGTPVPIDLQFIRDRAVNRCLIFDARGAAGWHHAHWGIPGSATVGQILQFSAFGAAPARWFSEVDPGAPSLHPRYRWSARLMRWGSLLAGVPLPQPRHVSPEQPLPIARWMAGVLRAGGTPHLYASASSAVRLCQAAYEAGVELAGARLTIGSEPITAARLAVIERVGARAAPNYGTVESGLIGSGCLAPTTPDDVHLMHDLNTVIQPRAAGGPGGVPRSALFVSSLRPTAPFVLLNVSLGDQATLEQRACGCPLERLGWSTHLHTVRSFEKLTAGGMTFLDTDVIRVLEEVLPARFGGGPTDYQLVEEEDESGRPRLRLLVHPRVGVLDAEAVADTFLSAIGPGSGAERVMALQWRQAGLLRVEREAPRATAMGKVLHLHTERRPRSPASDRP